MPLNVKEASAILEMQQYVMDLLKNYNQMKQEIEALQYELSRVEAFSADEMIEAMTYSTPTDERVDSGRVSNKTSDIALTYAQNLAEQKMQMTQQINIRLHWLCETAERLDFYIDSLEAYQASALREHYFDGFSWRELAQLKNISTTTLMKHRDMAIRRLSEKYDTLNRLGVIHFCDKIS